MRTLGEYRDMFAVVAGKDSRAVKFLDDKIKAQGRDQEVLADETQMVLLLKSMMDNVK